MILFGALTVSSFPHGQAIDLRALGDVILTAEDNGKKRFALLILEPEVRADPDDSVGVEVFNVLALDVGDAGQSHPRITITHCGMFFLLRLKSKTEAHFFEICFCLANHEKITSYVERLLACVFNNSLQ